MLPGGNEHGTVKILSNIAGMSRRSHLRCFLPGTVDVVYHDLRCFSYGGKLELQVVQGRPTPNGAGPNQFDESSNWQQGPDFLSLQDTEWPIMSAEDVSATKSQKSQSPYAQVR